MRRMLTVGLVLMAAAGCTRSANVDEEREAVLALDREWAQSTKDLARTASTFQVHAMGPFVVNYVNPADDPSKQAR